MRWLVLLMLVVNGLLFAYFTLEQDKQTMSQAGHEPLLPEKINIVTAAEIEKLPLREMSNTSSAPGGADPENATSMAADTNVTSTPSTGEVNQADPNNTTAPTVTSTTTPAPPAAACYEWGSFEQSRVAAARAVLNKLKIQYTLKQQTAEEALRYWVYLPKFPNAKAAQAKADELHQMGINDLFVVQEPKMKNAISFGMFKDEVLANKLLTELQLKGIQAEKLVRNQEKGQINLLTSAITADHVSDIEKMRPNFPGSEIKQIVCQ